MVTQDSQGEPEMFMIDQREILLKAKSKKDRTAGIMIGFVFLLICTSESLVDFLL